MRLDVEGGGSGAVDRRKLGSLVGSLPLAAFA